MAAAAMGQGASGTAASINELPSSLPGELSADQVLNGAYPFPPSPAVEWHDDAGHFAKDRVHPVPAAGLHPRILISPDELPDLRRRWKETEAGRALVASMRKRLADAIGKPNTPGHDLYEALAAGDQKAAMAVINAHPEMLGTVAHYQFYMPTCMAWASLDALVNEDAAAGKKAANALTTWAELIGPSIEQDLNSPLSDDVFRIAAMPNVNDPKGSARFSGKFRDLLGYQVIGYAYDFSYSFMTDAQRATVRGLIARCTAGRLWMGCRLPHHFRNWNWIEIGLSQPLLALAIEGEEGYDPRIYKLGVEIARDYLTYGISAKGSATEAVGYMGFGLVWGNPFAVAATRRGDSLLTHSHYRALADWYIQSAEPGIPGTYQSHGDGGDAGPSPWTLHLWKYFYPTDPRVQFLWQNYASTTEGKPYDGAYHIVEALLFACDAPPASDKPAEANWPTTFIDAERGSVNARSGWLADATSVQFECRQDSVGASHEHADRGNFTLASLGRLWAKESFRSVETRYHNSVLIDGMGQGYWPGPGKWLGVNDQGWALTTACDAKAAYDWWWPKQILAEPDSFVRFRYQRWANYAKEADQFRANNAGVPVVRDDRPSVVAHWKGFADVAGGPRMWDEDGWPVRLPHNPVKRAFRTLTFVRGSNPYVLVADDIQKDEQERLYEWIMMTGPNTDTVSIKDNDIILCDATAPRDANGLPKLKKGDRQLLVRVVQSNIPKSFHDFQARPTARLEAIEKKDSLAHDGRSFGLDKRLIIPSRAVSPDFKVMLFPMRAGDEVPKTIWDAAMTKLTVEWHGKSDVFAFAPSTDGRTRIGLTREGEKALSAIEPDR